jgi:hypothetical protein
MTLIDHLKREFFHSPEVAPKAPEAAGCDAMAGTAGRRRARSSHQIWTRADGFTLAGPRRG